MVREYEEAYETFNAALTIARIVRREMWIEVVENILHTLSFQLLIAEGREHVQTLDTSQAIRCFELAAEIGSKAGKRNMIGAAERSVAQACVADIERCHRKASTLVGRLMEDTTDEWPAKASAKETGAAEKQRVLQLKEALDRWAEVFPSWCPPRCKIPAANAGILAQPSTCVLTQHLRTNPARAYHTPATPVRARQYQFYRRRYIARCHATPSSPLHYRRRHSARSSRTWRGPG